MALGRDQAADASELSGQRQRAALDEAELRDLERAEYYGETPAVVQDTTSAAGPRRSVLDRILRR